MSEIWNRDKESDFIKSCNLASLHAYETAHEKGFNEQFESMGEGGEYYIVPRDRLKRLLSAERIALMHSELSEALEYERHGNPPDDKVPGYSGVEAEFADTIIRIFHQCAARGFRIGEAIVDKMKFNKSRPYRHGKTF